MELEWKSWEEAHASKWLSTRVNSKESLKPSECHIGTDVILFKMNLHHL